MVKLLHRTPGSTPGPHALQGLCTGIVRSGALGDKAALPWKYFGSEFCTFSCEGLNMQIFLWQGTLFAMACNICACMKLHGTLLQVP